MACPAAKSGSVAAECIFCRIVAGAIPAERVYEDDALIAIRDINPQAPTHLLLIPRRHIGSLADLTPADRDLGGALLLAAGALADRLRLVRGFRLVANSGPEGGQTVPHLHLHLLGGRAMGWPPG